MESHHDKRFTLLQANLSHTAAVGRLLEREEKQRLAEMEFWEDAEQLGLERNVEMEAFLASNKEKGGELAKVGRGLIEEDRMDPLVLLAERTGLAKDSLVAQGTVAGQRGKLDSEGGGDFFGGDGGVGANKRGVLGKKGKGAGPGKKGGSGGGRKAGPAKKAGVKPLYYPESRVVVESSGPDDGTRLPLHSSTLRSSSRRRWFQEILPTSSSGDESSGGSEAAVRAAPQRGRSLSPRPRPDDEPRLRGGKSRDKQKKSSSQKSPTFGTHSSTKTPLPDHDGTGKTSPALGKKGGGPAPAGIISEANFPAESRLVQLGPDHKHRKSKFLQHYESRVLKLAGSERILAPWNIPQQYKEREQRYRYAIPASSPWERHRRLLFIGLGLGEKYDGHREFPDITEFLQKKQVSSDEFQIRARLYEEACRKGADAMEEEELKISRLAMIMNNLVGDQQVEKVSDWAAYVAGQLQRFLVERAIAQGGVSNGDGPSGAARTFCDPVGCGGGLG